MTLDNLGDKIDRLEDRLIKRVGEGIKVFFGLLASLAFVAAGLVVVATLARAAWKVAQWAWS